MSQDNPFSPVFTRQSFLETVAVGEVLARLDHGLGAREPFLLLTGESGIGKTALAQEAIARWGSSVTAAFLACPARSAPELLEEIVLRFGAEAPGGASRPKLVACLEKAVTDIAARGQVAVIVVDDAHHLTPELLEELRLLVGAMRHPIEVLLIGQPSLETNLEDSAMASLYQRISVRAKLSPLSPGEIRRYLRHRATAAGLDAPTLFPRSICMEIAGIARGIPRRINTLAAEAVRLARAAGTASVHPEHVQAAVASLRGDQPFRIASDHDDEREQAAHPRPAASVSPAPSVKPLEAAPPAPPATPAPPQPAPAASAPPVAKPAPTPPPAPKPAPAVVTPPIKPAPAPALPPAPMPAPPAVTPPIAKPMPAPASTPVPTPAPAPAAESPRPIPAFSQDKAEWVARFVGEKGPIQIGSAVTNQPKWMSEPLEPLDETPADAGEPVRPPTSPKPPKAAPPAKRFALRIKLPNFSPFAIIATMAACVLIAAVMVILRVGGQRANRAASASANMVGPDAPAQKPAPQNPKSKSRSSSDGAESSSAASGAARHESLPPNWDSNWRGPYSIQVASGIDLQHALEERDRVQPLTGIESWVVPATDGSPDAYRVVVGMFRSHERALSAANMLVNSHTLPHAFVVPLPPKYKRQ